MVEGESFASLVSESSRKGLNPCQSKRRSHQRSKKQNNNNNLTPNPNPQNARPSRYKADLPPLPSLPPPPPCKPGSRYDGIGLGANPRSRSSPSPRYLQLPASAHLRTPTYHPTSLLA